MTELDRNYLRDKELCPCCHGHGFLDTALSIAFGLGLNCQPNTRNPYKWHQHKLFVNFEMGKKSKSRETLKKAFEKLCKH